MTNPLTARRTEIESNFEAFERMLTSLLPAEQGRFAILREAELIETFGSLNDAISAAQSKFLDGKFSIQEVIKEPLDLGFYSHARLEGQLRDK